MQRIDFFFLKVEGNKWRGRGYIPFLPVEGGYILDTERVIQEYKHSTDIGKNIEISDEEKIFLFETIFDDPKIKVSDIVFEPSGGIVVYFVLYSLFNSSISIIFFQNINSKLVQLTSLPPLKFQYIIIQNGSFFEGMDDVEDNLKINSEQSYVDLDNLARNYIDSNKIIDSNFINSITSTKISSRSEVEFQHSQIGVPVSNTQFYLPPQRRPIRIAPIPQQYYPIVYPSKNLNSFPK